MAASMMKIAVSEQNRRLIEYAKAKIIEIGDEIQTYNSKNHMDRTGHLLDSLLWGVSYDGKLVEGGFYRSSQARGDSYLHEWFSGDEKYLLPVNGRQVAQNYMQKYGNNGASGWRVFFAILAPYWGYWEKGFTMRSGGGNSGIPNSSRFLQFAVMTQFYDVIKNDLKPARVRYRISVAKYEHEKLKKRWERYANTGR
jgi:hypothetical protein